jgi:hypothetical protein
MRQQSSMLRIEWRCLNFIAIGNPEEVSSTNTGSGWFKGLVIPVLSTF